MNSFVKHSISLFAAFLVATISLFSQELVSTGLSKDTILIGDHIEWNARINVPTELTMDFDSLANPVVPGVEVISHFSIDTLSIKKKIAQIEAKAVLTSFDSGSYMLPDRIFYFYKDGNEVDTLKISGPSLEVETIPIDTANFEMFDIKPQFTYPVTFGEIFPWIALLIVVAGIVFLVWKFIRNRRENKTLFGKPIIKDPPHIIALRSLDKIRNEKLWQNNKEKQFYTSITDTLRIYLEGRFHIKTMERTSSEILDDLSHQDIKPTEFEELKELLERSDLVKFAKAHATDQENESAIPTAVRFVNATFLQEIEEENNG